MKISIDKKQQEMLLAIINNAGFKGEAAEIVVELKKAITEAKE